MLAFVHDVQYPALSFLTALDLVGVWKVKGLLAFVQIYKVCHV